MSTGNSSRQTPLRAGRRPTRVVVRLLGHFEVSVDDAVVLLTAGSRRLVAYLALRGTTPRARVAGELWPETTQARAMGRLRTATWRVNQATHGLVSARGEALDLNAGSDVDVRQVLLSSVTMLTATSSPTGRGLPPPVDLLPGWEEEWLVHDRERVRQLQLHVLEAGSERLTALGEFGLAIEWALAAIRADPLRESAHRAVIRAHVAEGNLTEARRAYDACADLFRFELGVRPSNRTSALLLAVERDAVVTMQ